MGYGGALIWTGLARNLKREFPNKKIIFVYKATLKNILFLKKNTDLEIYRNNPDIDIVTNQICFYLLKFQYNHKKAIIVDLRDNKYQYWIDDNDCVTKYKQNEHAITIACQPFNLTTVELKTKLILDQAESSEVQKLLNKFNLNNNKFICVEPNAKKTFTTNKQWPLENWQKLVDLLNDWFMTEKLDYLIVQLGVNNSPLLNGVINLTGTTTFRQIKDIITRADLVIANEGGIAHLAASTDTKAVIIYNPALPLELMAYPQNINITPQGKNHNCGQKKTCQVCHDLLNLITPDSVFREIISQLK